MSVKRTYPDTSLFTQNSANIDGYNGVTIDSIVSGGTITLGSNATLITGNSNTITWTANGALNLNCGGGAITLTDGAHTGFASDDLRFGNSANSLLKMLGSVFADFNFLKEVNHTIAIADSTSSNAVGANLTVKAASATNGNAGGGSLTLDSGAKVGSGIDGYVYIGTTNANQVHIGKTAFTSFVDGYLSIDGYVTLSHDVGYTDSIALTQPSNTTTGADLRLRHLRFFSDNAPTNQAPQTIYATGGDLVLSSPSQNVMIDAPLMYWAQNASIYSGGFSLQVGPFHNYIKMTDSPNNTTPGYDFVSTMTGGSVGTNYSLRDVVTTTYTASGVDTVAHYLNIVNNTNDAYSGSTTGLLIDVSGGSNTSFPKTAAKFTGGKIWVDGYLQQTNGAVSLTANAVSQISTTSGNLTLDSAALLKLGSINATSTVIGRDGYTLEIDAYGHLITLNTTVPNATPGAGAGTGGTATIYGHDVDGYIVIATGTATSSNSVICTITFGSAYPAAPRNILLSPGNLAASDQTGNSAAFTPVIGAANGPTTTTWTIMSGTNSLSNNTTYIWNYLVIG